MGFALFCIVIGIIILIGFNEEFSWLGVSFIVVGIISLFNKKKKYYCADCGQFLGNRPKNCDRCGCNRWTTTDPGVGKTTKNR